MLSLLTIYLVGLIGNLGFASKLPFLRPRIRRRTVFYLVLFMSLYLPKSFHEIPAVINICLVFLICENIGRRKYFSVNLYLLASIILMILQKSLLFRSDFSGGFADSLNSSGTFAVTAIYILFRKSLVTNYLKSWLFIPFLLIGFLFSEAKILLYSMPLLFISNISVKRALSLITVLLSLFFFADYIDWLMSWSNDVRGNYVVNFIKDPMMIFTRYFTSIEHMGTMQQFNRLSTIIYFFEEADIEAALFGFGSGAMNTTLFGKGGFVGIKLFRSGLSLILFNFGIVGLTIILAYMSRYTSVLLYFFLLLYSGAALGTTFLLILITNETILRRSKDDIW